jgi:hypothetical protein
MPKRNRFCAKCGKTQRLTILHGWVHYSEVDAVICAVEW